MGTIDSKKLNAALAKAKNIGLVEEPCTIAGCDLVLRSLRAEDYTGVLQDCDGLPEEEYIHRYQKGHLARAIVEVNGVDLRDSRFVEVDEPDATGAMRKVTLELHQYLEKHMLATWGKEVVDIAFRKLGDVLELAEQRAKTGVNFIVPDESEEQKYRRLLLEARALEKDMPATLLDKILEEHGLVRQSTAEEIKQVKARTEQLAHEQEAREQEKTQASAAPPPDAGKAAPVLQEPDAIQPATPATPPASPATVSRPQRVVDPHATLQNAIASRKALEVPVVKSEQADNKPAVSRSAVIAALEGTGDAAPDLSTAVSLQQGDVNEVIEIKQAPIDLQAAHAIVDNPPIAGINPRFRPQQKA